MFTLLGQFSNDFIAAGRKGMPIVFVLHHVITGGAIALLTLWPTQGTVMVRMPCYRQQLLDECTKQLALHSDLDLAIGFAPLRL